MKPKNKRLISISTLFMFFALGCWILLSNLRDNIVFFYSPSEVFEKDLDSNKVIRVGGMVKEKSLEKKIKRVEGRNLEEISFIITDFNKEIKISYLGILPDLFKEGQGVVVEGLVVNRYLVNAKSVLAKHDENYMPPEIKGIKSIKDKQNDI
ncbi:MAG: cytochrome c maturation protein CcmE [Alphaproteobacteria bacterium]|tara:strand:- start:321 stop:776 length:456 start_codon:yes stop_codon:yes gene_type:complete